MTHTLVGFILLSVGPVAVAAAQSCPNVDPASGYPLSLAVTDSSVVPAAWADEMARALAYRWVVPSRRRNEYSGWHRVTRRILPPEPRWADDWQPEERHRARLVFSIARGGTVSRGEVESGSGDRTFDQSLRSMLDAPMPGSPPLPPLPASVEAESLTLVVSVGFVDPRALSVVRFAAQQSPVGRGTSDIVVRLPFVVRSEGPGRPPPPPSPSGRATVKYDVTEYGTVDMGSFEILDASDPNLARAIRDGVANARLAPALSNCRAIALTVVQTFGR